MRNIELLRKAIETLLYSWGGDTPSEAIWSLNELIDWIESETGLSLPRFDEEFECVYEEILDEILRKLDRFSFEEESEVYKRRKVK